MALLLLIVSIGCAHAPTSLTTQSAPERAADGYHRVMVEFPVKDLRIESLVEDELAAGDSSLVAAYRTIHQRVRTAEDLERVIVEEHLDALLVLSVDSAGAPPIYFPSTSAAQSTAPGPAACVDSTVRGGGDVSRPWAIFRAQLIDLESLELVWMGTASSGSDAVRTSEDRLRSLARATADRLRLEHVIR